LAERCRQETIFNLVSALSVPVQAISFDGKILNGLTAPGSAAWPHPHLQCAAFSRYDCAENVMMASFVRHANPAQQAKARQSWTGGHDHKAKTLGRRPDADGTQAVKMAKAVGDRPRLLLLDEAASGEHGRVEEILTWCVNSNSKKASRCWSSST